MAGVELMRSLLEEANRDAHEEAGKETYSISPTHVERALKAFPELLEAVQAMPKNDKKKKPKKKLFKGEEMQELIAAQNALFDQAKAKRM